MVWTPSNNMLPILSLLLVFFSEQKMRLMKRKIWTSKGSQKSKEEKYK